MASISLNISDELSTASSKLAERIGITRTELIRQALNHEIKAIESQLELQSMAEAFSKMNSDEMYMLESENIDSGFGSSISEENDVWWQ